MGIHQNWPSSKYFDLITMHNVNILPYNGGVFVCILLSVSLVLALAILLKICDIDWFFLRTRTIMRFARAQHAWNIESVFSRSAQAMLLQESSLIINRGKGHICHLDVYVRSELEAHIQLNKVTQKTNEKVK